MEKYMALECICVFVLAIYVGRSWVSLFVEVATKVL